jgi:hypothetical protein
MPKRKKNYQFLCGTADQTVPPTVLKGLAKTK